MYEELKQEIRDVVKPNFRQQINGQNLQDVLIDMVDNYPAVSGSEELNELIAKSGSWDNAADWITNNSGSLVTSESLAPVVEDLKDEIAEMGDTYATTASVNTLSASLDERINNIITGSGVDLSGYATTASVNAATESVKEWVEDKHYLTEHQDISGLATTASVNSLSESVANDFANLDIPDISGLATTASVNSLSSSLHQDIQNVEGNLSEYATTASVNSLSESVANDFANLDIPDISGLATTSSVNSLSESVGTISASFDQRISSITGSGGSGLWYAGTGNEAVRKGMSSTASGEFSVAEGKSTKAEGSASHAEGFLCAALGAYSHAEGHSSPAVGIASHAENQSDARGNYSHAENFGYTSEEAHGAHAEGNSSAKASWAHAENLSSARGDYSHAEGNSEADGRFSHAEGSLTTSSGDYSHAEGSGSRALGTASHAGGYCTIASNSFEYAIGQYNRSSGSSGQLFSIGCGYDNNNRKNAVTVIDDRTYIAGVGNYDGRYPSPGSNDIASVISRLAPTSSLLAYATTASVNQLSESVSSTSASFDQRINDISGSGGGGDYLPLAGGTLTGNLQVNASVGVGTAPGGTNCLVVGSSGTEANSAHNSVVVGEDCHASVWNAFAAGRENYVETNGAFGSVTGFRNRVNAMAAYAGGCRSTGSGEFATAIGFGAAANSKGQVVLGSYNEPDPTGNRTSTGSYAVIFGIGKSSTWNQDDPGNVTRQNGLAIKWNGDIDINYSGSIVALQAKIAELEAIRDSYETWTFVLEDSSSVTKSVLVR